MFKLLFMLCLGCTDYGTVDQKLRYQHKVYDTLVIVDEFNTQNLPEPLPREDDKDWEKILPFPYPGKEGNDGGMIDPDIYRLND